MIAENNIAVLRWCPQEKCAYWTADDLAHDFISTYILPLILLYLLLIVITLLKVNISNTPNREAFIDTILENIFY